MYLTGLDQKGNKEGDVCLPSKDVKVKEHIFWGEGCYSNQKLCMRVATVQMAAGVVWHSVFVNSEHLERKTLS